MNVTINISPEIAPKVEQAASRKGRDVAQFIEELVEKSVSGPSLDEILEPVRAQFAASGLTEDELDKVFEEERQTIWEEKQRKRA